MDDLRIERQDGFGLAAIMARRGVGASQIGAVLEVKAPTVPASCSNLDGLSLIGTGAGTWLAYADGVSPFWADELRRRLDGLASVSDQSGAYVVVRLTGLGARTLLQRGMAIDFHPDAFSQGSVASTVIAHIGVIVWRVDDRPTYDVATFRSYSDSFRQWLDQAVAAL